jgi:hypothetical protein
MILGGGDSGIDKQTAKLTEKESGAAGYKKATETAESRFQGQVVFIAQRIPCHFIYLLFLCHEAWCILSQAAS